MTPTEKVRKQSGQPRRSHNTGKTSAKTRGPELQRPFFRLVNSKKDKKAISGHRSVLCLGGHRAHPFLQAPAGSCAHDRRTGRARVSARADACRPTRAINHHQHDGKKQSPLISSATAARNSYQLREKVKNPGGEKAQVKDTKKGSRSNNKVMAAAHAL